MICLPEVCTDRKRDVVPPSSSVLVDSWLPCKDPSRLKGKEKGLDLLPAFAKASNNQIWPCIVEKVPPAPPNIFSSLCACLLTYVRFSVSAFGPCVLFFSGVGNRR